MLTSEELCDKCGMLDRKEVKLLKRCARTLRSNSVIVNIGAGFGTSAAAFLEARPDAFVFSVDKIRRPEERDNLVLCGIDVSKCVRLLGNSWEIGRNFPFQVDMVFVDGDHGNEAVQKDIDSWLPKIVEGGIIAFHDYKHRNVPGLTVVVDKAMKNNQHFGEQRYLVAFLV